MAPRGERDTPAGVFVLGMHRSGTSVATRVVNLLGVPVCQPLDLVQDRRGNPRGHWESRSLVAFNDMLLARLGGTWWCPPDQDHGWTTRRAWQPLLHEARQAFRAVHPTVQWVWKDPRTCLTLPFWLAALDELPVAILVLRNPLEVAHSLAKRNRFGIGIGLALWEQYLHRAAAAATGIPTVVTRYDGLLADPPRWSQEAARFLASHGLVLDSARHEKAIKGFVESALRHNRCSRAQLAASPQVTAQQLELYDRLHALVGTSDRFAPGPLPTPAEQSVQLLRRFGERYGSPQRRLDNGRSAGSMDRPRPTVSVIVISHNEGAQLGRTVRDFREVTRPGDEIIVVDDVSTDGSTAGLDTDGVRLETTARQLGVARARNRGARSARGEVLVFADGHVRAATFWLEPLLRTLAQPRVGAVNPSIRVMGGANCVDGLTFSGPQLNVAWLQHGGPRPHPVPFLVGCFMAMRRDVYEQVGGFDDGMTGYGAEDLELCLRLWRMGYECLVVPKARVAHRFRQRTPAEVDWVAFLHNVLRLATLHLAPERLARVVNELRRHPAFPVALGQLLAGDAGRRRQELAGVCVHDDAWFLEQFGIRAFEIPDEGEE